MDRHGEAVAFHRQAAAVHRDLADAWELAVELGHWAAALHPADPEGARAHWAEALTRLAPYTAPRAEAARAQWQGAGRVRLKPAAPVGAPRALTGQTC